MATQSIDLITNTTGIRMASALEAIAHRQVAKDIIDYEAIRNIVASGNASGVFNVGEFINTKYTTEDGTEYVMPWHVAGFRNVTLKNGDVVPGMVIQCHYLTPEEVQFDNYEAFYYAKEELPPETYHVKVKETFGAITSGTSFQFTLTKALPAGGVLCGFNNESTTGNVISYAKVTDAEPIETVPMTMGSAGTELGTGFTLKGDDTLNSIQKASYGYNRWSHSLMRKWLNGNAKSYFKASNPFDRPPSTLVRGFKDNFEPEFLNILKPVKVTTALNTVSDVDLGSSEDTYDTFFLPSLEEMNINTQASGVEGDILPYWKQATGISGKVPWYTSTPELVHLRLDNKQPDYVRLRSAYRNGACNTWGVHPSGYVGGSSARVAFRCSPLAVIC